MLSRKLPHKVLIAQTLLGTVSSYLVRFVVLGSGGRAGERRVLTDLSAYRVA